jgi:signal transduction histidine kinase
MWLGWMILLAVTASEEFRLEGLAWASVGAAAAWTVWLSVTNKEWTRATLYFDILLCVWLICASGLVIEQGGVISGRPFFATGYPLSAALFWGAARGPWGGLAAGLVLGLAQVASRPLNGVPLEVLTSAQVQNLTGAALNYIVAGVAIGLVSLVLVRSATALQEASKEVVRVRERAARLEERESLARQIHDSVLQSLAYIHKRGRELASAAQPEAAEIGRLSDMAAEQEAELRALILRDPDDAPTGTASLRDALEAAARRVTGIEVSVGSVGALHLPAAMVGEIAAAVRQALENSAAHSGADRAAVFAEQEDGALVVTVRDPGTGFVYDEASLRERGKAGILKSMKGRAEDLGGTFSIQSGAASGTEIELRIPMSEESR